MLRWAVIVFNIGGMGFVFFILAREGISTDLSALFAFVFLIGFALSALYAISTGGKNGDGLWHLFVEVQKAKLKKQISQVNASDGS